MSDHKNLELRIDVLERQVCYLLKQRYETIELVNRLKQRVDNLIERPVSDIMREHHRKSNFSVMGVEIILSNDIPIDQIEIIAKDGRKVTVVNTGKDE